jgi:hypothetical protein
VNLAELIQAAAARHHVAPSWLQAVVGAESAGRPNALSPKGAMGLGQLMPGTAREMGVTNPWDPAQNIEGSAGYLEKMQAMFHGDRTLATAAYNWGPGNLQKQGLQNAPAETRNYLARIAQLSNDPGLATSQVMQGQMPNGSQAAPQPSPNPPAPPAPPEPMQSTPQELAAGQPPPMPDNSALSGLVAQLQQATPGVAPTGVVGAKKRSGFLGSLV